VWIKAVTPLRRAISLEECKVTPGLEQMVLVNNTRLSVQPVRPEEWQIICRLGGVEP
jgi:predicted RNA-binding protein with PUA-like domain